MYSKIIMSFDKEKFAVWLCRERFSTIWSSIPCARVCNVCSYKNAQCFGERDSVHRDATYLGLSLDMPLLWRPLCLFIARTLL
jgi:hypothetical protein